MIKQRKINPNVKILLGKRKRKNPEMEEQAEKILFQFGKNIKFKYLNEGGYAETYYFAVNNSDRLNPGEYVLKIFTEKVITVDQIKYLTLISKYGLIPKIFHINKEYLIMKYVRSTALDQFIKIEYSHGERIITSDILSKKEINSILIKVANLLNKWHDLNLSHGDIHAGNILITRTGKIYLIDPDIEKLEYNKKRDIRFFKEIYDSVNNDLPFDEIDENIRKLFP